MFEIGDAVREIETQEVRTIAGIGPAEFFRTQLGSDGASIKMLKADAFELVAKAPKPKQEPGFYPDRSIME
jgi:hypothetical protein